MKWLVVNASMCTENAWNQEAEVQVTGEGFDIGIKINEEYRKNKMEALIDWIEARKG